MARQKYQYDGVMRPKLGYISDTDNPAERARAVLGREQDTGGCRGWCHNCGSPRDLLNLNYDPRPRYVLGLSTWPNMYA